MKKTDPKMHSAEHLLNQTMVRMFGCDRCFSAHVNPKKSKCDYRFDRPLEDREVRKLEERVNREIKADHPVTDEAVPLEAARARFNIKRVPEPAPDTLRIVNIGDYDACPCIGSHVTSTAEIGFFRIISSSFEDGVLRVRFKLPKAPPES